MYWRFVAHPLLSHSHLALLFPTPRYVFYIHFAFPVAFSICLHERVAAIFIPPLEINPPATRALFVHLEANVYSRGIIHDPVNINKCIFSLSTTPIFSSFSHLPPAPPPLSLSLTLFRLRQSITLPSPARRRACTHACVHARMYLREWLVRTHAYTCAHARMCARTHMRKVSNLADGRPTGGCWMLTPPSLSSLRNDGDQGSSGARWGGEPERDRSIPKGMRSLFLRVSILLDV